MYIKTKTWTQPLTGSNIIKSWNYHLNLVNLLIQNSAIKDVLVVPMKYLTGIFFFYFTATTQDQQWYTMYLFKYIDDIQICTTYVHFRG